MGARIWQGILGSTMGAGIWEWMQSTVWRKACGQAYGQRGARGGGGGARLLAASNIQGGGGASPGDNFPGKTSPFQLVRKFFLRNVFAQFDNDSWLTVTVIGCLACPISGSL